MTQRIELIYGNGNLQAKQYNARVSYREDLTSNKRLWGIIRQ